MRRIHRHLHSRAWVPREDDNMSGRENGLFRFDKTNHEGKDSDRGLPVAGLPRFGPSRVVSGPSFSSIILSRDHRLRQTTLPLLFPHFVICMGTHGPFSFSRSIFASPVVRFNQGIADTGSDG